MEISSRGRADGIVTDWGAGNYARIAIGLLPAAAGVIAAAELRPGERVLDVGCGTGNAALLAAERGADVIGVDPAASLVELAGAAAGERGVEATFVVGDAAGLPVPDGSIDLVVSVFGVIFAGDAPAAGAELARVTAPSGRIVLSAWLPGGVFGEAMRLRRKAVAASGRAGGRPPGAWHDREAVADLLGRSAFTVEVEERALSFSGRSPAEFACAELADHPVWVATREVLEPRGEWQEVQDRTVELFAAANEDPAAFRVTSRYVIVSARRVWSDC